MVGHWQWILPKMNIMQEFHYLPSPHEGAVHISTLALPRILPRSGLVRKRWTPTNTMIIDWSKLTRSGPCQRGIEHAWESGEPVWSSIRKVLDTSGRVVNVDGLKEPTSKRSKGQRQRFRAVKIRSHRWLCHHHRFAPCEDHFCASLAHDSF